LVDLTNESLPTKIIDFGFATQTQTKDVKQTAFCGTPAYMSPQMCKKMDYDGASVDIWAAGILFFTILMGYQPFKAGTEQELFKKIIKGNINYPKSCHHDYTGGIP